MQKLAKFRSDQNGSGLFLCIFVLFFMLGVGGLVVDMGIAYKAKSEMRKAANAAALSGAGVIFEGDDRINAVVDDILAANKEDDCTLTEPVKVDKYKITVKLDKTISTYFMKIFGIDTIPITVSSSAKVTPVSGMTGAMPLGVSAESLGLDENMQLKKDMEWAMLTLKEDPAGNTSFGKYGIISFNKNDALSDVDPKKDPGAKLYKQYLQSGYPNQIDIGDILFTESGSVASDDKIMKDKINNSKYNSIDAVKTAFQNNTLNYTDSRIMLVIIYKEGNFIDADHNVREITVAGFAYFYLASYTKDGNNRQIDGYIIPRILNSTNNDDALKLGSYTIKLVE